MAPVLPPEAVPRWEVAFQAKAGVLLNLRMMTAHVCLSYLYSLSLPLEFRALHMLGKYFPQWVVPMPQFVKQI